MSLTQRLKKLFVGKRETDPAQAYRLWAAFYDSQPGNLVLDLDEKLFSQLLNETTIPGKVVADIGCGTGRHWQKIMDKAPGRLIGFDISAEMLDKLKEKFPAAETFQVNNEELRGMEDNSCDLIVSTLTIAHIPSLEKAFAEWRRVLKPGGGLIITDYHPALLAKGGQRTFRYGNKLIAVKSYIHMPEKVRQMARQLRFNEMRFTERVIDESVKAYYEKQDALPLFEKFSGIPVIYGIYLKKSDDPAWY